MPSSGCLELHWLTLGPQHTSSSKLCLLWRAHDESSSLWTAQMHGRSTCSSHGPPPTTSSWREVDVGAVFAISSTPESMTQVHQERSVITPPQHTHTAHHIHTYFLSPVMSLATPARLSHSATVVNTLLP